MNDRPEGSPLDAVPILAIGAGVLMAWLLPAGAGLAAGEEATVTSPGLVALGAIAAFIVARLALRPSR